MLTFAQFGAGRIGRMHARNLAANPHVRLAGIHDPDPAARAEVAAESGCSAVASIDGLLNDSAIDAVLIASSTDTHCELIERSARAGKAILCEKPIHLDLNRLGRCWDIVAAAGVPVQIGFNRRFDPSHRALRQAVVAGEIGRIEQVLITSRDPYPPPLDYLRASGGIFRDMTIHDFDMCRFLFSEEPVEVSAMGTVLVDPRIGEMGDSDGAMVVLRMESGALCHINCSRRCPYGYDQRIEVFGTDGMLISDNPAVNNITRFSATATSARERLHSFFVERYAESYVLEVAAFVDAVESGVAPSPAFHDGRQALVLANAALESASTGRTVRVRAQL